MVTGSCQGVSCRELVPVYHNNSNVYTILWKRVLAVVIPVGLEVTLSPDFKAHIISIRNASAIASIASSHFLPDHLIPKYMYLKKCKCYSEMTWLCKSWVWYVVCTILSMYMCTLYLKQPNVPKCGYNYRSYGKAAATLHGLTKKLWLYTILKKIHSIKGESLVDLCYSAAHGAGGEQSRPRPLTRLLQRF